jgi:hypothetical protein
MAALQPSSKCSHILNMLRFFIGLRLARNLIRGFETASNNKQISKDVLYYVFSLLQGFTSSLQAACNAERENAKAMPFLMKN